MYLIEGEGELEPELGVAAVAEVAAASLAEQCKVEQREEETPAVDWSLKFVDVAPAQKYGLALRGGTVVVSPGLRGERVEPVALGT